MEHEEATPDTPRCSPRYRFLIPVFIVVGILVFTTVVMLLWNAIIPDLTGWSQLTWPKALGLLVLCKILFGGFKGKGGHGGPWRRWGGPKGGPGSGEHMGWKEKWHNMTDEQRQRMRDEVLSTNAKNFRQFAEALEQVNQHGQVVVMGSAAAIEAVNAERKDWLKVVKVL